jgi:Winged helix-turn helix
VGQVATAIKLEAEVRGELEQRAASLTLPYRVVVRAKLVLLAAEGATNREIAERVDMSADRVGDWRRRFRDEGIEGLEDRARSGRPRRFPPGGGRRGQCGRLRAAQDPGRSALALQSL